MKIAYCVYFQCNVIYKVNSVLSKAGFASRFRNHAVPYVTGYEKSDHFMQNMRFFGIFQTVTIPRPQKPQASDLVSKQFGPSTSQIQC